MTIRDWMWSLWRGWQECSGAGAAGLRESVHQQMYALPAACLLYITR